MSGRWFRVYDEMVDDPKVQMLSDKNFRALVNIWCLASRNNGVLPPVEQAAFSMRMKPKQLSEVIGQLTDADLLEHNQGVVRPHNWDGRQFKSDITDPTHAERQRRHRERTAIRTAERTDDRTSDRTGDTPQRTETDTESETEKKTSLRSGKDRKSKTVSALEEVLDETRAAAVVEHRAKLRKPLTPHAARLLAIKFSECDDPNAAADVMIAQGWQGFHREWLTPDGRSSNGTPRRASGLDALMNAAAELDEELSHKPEIGNGQLKLLR